VAKYNPSSIQHRTWLASDILDLLVKRGFSIDQELSEKAWEFVCSRVDKLDSSKKIIIYTSIEKLTGAMRENSRDRIRVLRNTVIEGKTHFVRVARINRTGSFSDINTRVCDSIVKAQKTLGKSPFKRY